MKRFYSVFHKMAWTPRELDECARATAEFVRTASWGCRIAPQHSGKLRERSVKAAAKLVSLWEKSGDKEAEDAARGGEISSLARVINSTMPQNGAGLVQKIWHSPAPEKQFIKQKPPLTQSLHKSSLPLSSLPSLPLSPLFSFTRLNSKKWMISEREGYF